MKKFFKLKHLQIVISVITIVSMVVPYNFQPVLAATDLATIDNVPLVETEVVVEPVAETPTVLGEEVSEIPVIEPAVEEPVIEPIVEPVREGELLFTPQPAPECPNGIKDGAEQCDDGNRVDGDGCSANCTLETTSSCDQREGSGWWAEYFNYPRTHEDMNLDISLWPDAEHGNPMGTWDADWYTQPYFRFSRVDSNLNFGNFFPFDFAKEEEDNGHEYHFGVHWRAKVTAPSDGDYSYNLRSDDDSWVYVDGSLFDSGLAGIHAPTTSTTTTMYLTAGDHTVDVFYAERHIVDSYMDMNLDAALTITPLPKDCPNMCVSKLDFVDVNGNLTPDEDHGLGDATTFTGYYLPALGTTSTMPLWNEKADVNSDGIVNVKDYLCADKYYSTGLYECPIDCSDICSSPLDYDKDYEIGLGDGTTFTVKYETSLQTTIYDAEVDLNNNGSVDYGDYVCANQYISTGDYQCNLSCQATCGDLTIQKRLGEECDDGDIENGDGCNQFCKTETNQCDEPNVLDYDGDFELTFDDAVLFGNNYLTDNILADINNNGVVDYGDKLCADPYYKNGLAYTCTIGCEEYTPVCGDTHVDTQLQETCDDGNLRNNDGCSSSCQLEGEQCVGTGTYTVNSEFDQGTLINVIHTPSDQLQLDESSTPLNFMWVAVSSKGTVVKINTDTAEIVGEYRSTPSVHGNGDPSRTTVDKDGSVWLSNRSNVYEGVGSVVHIGLVENGQCEDRNSNGIIDTSIAQDDIKAWSDASGTRSVATADDECIVHYVKLPNASGTRHVSVTADNDVWVAGYYSKNFDLIKGGKWSVPGSGTIIRSESSVGYGGYGGLITPDGVIWSANQLMRWDTSLPLAIGNFIGYGHDSYGLCIDKTGNVWNTSLSGDQIRKFAPNGDPLGTFSHGSYYAQGCVVDNNNDVWVAGSLYDTVVGHLLNDGTLVGVVPVGSGPTGVAVDSNGKIWATNYNSGTVSRIDPALGGTGGGGATIGAVDFTTPYLGGSPYNYSDMTGSTLAGKANSGTWTVIHDGQTSGTPWQNITWNANVPEGGSIVVTVASSEDGITFGPAQTITSGQDLTAVTARYLKIVVTFERGVTGESPILYDLTATRACGQEPTGSLTICKYLDNGVQGTYEQGTDTPLAWNFIVTALTGANEGDVWNTGSNGETGCVTLSGLPYGDYQSTEASVTGWTRTYPVESGIQTASLDSETPDQTVMFMNIQNPTGPVCGNEIIESGEQCDDGNAVGGDGCSATCQTEQVGPVAPSGGGGGGGGGGAFFYVSLQVDKTVTPTAVEPGSQLTYNVKITNRGNLIGANLTLKDTLPAGFTFVDNGTITKEWSWDTISPNQTMEVTYLVNVSSTAANGTYTNTAIADVTNGPATQDSADVRVGAPSVLGINTEELPAAPNGPAGENVQVLGFEELPNTSGGFNLLEMLAIFMSLASGMYLASRLIVDKKQSTR